MITVLTEQGFSLLAINEESKGNFKPQAWQDLSTFHAAALKWVGDAIRGNGSQWFWNDGAYCWYTDERQSSEQRVWQTENGILILEDCTSGILFRVLIN